MFKEIFELLEFLKKKSKSILIILYPLWKKASEKQLPKGSNNNYVSYYIFRIYLWKHFETYLTWVPLFGQSIKMQSRSLSANVLWYIPHVN